MNSRAVITTSAGANTPSRNTVKSGLSASAFRASGHSAYFFLGLPCRLGLPLLLLSALLGVDLLLLSALFRRS